MKLFFAWLVLSALAATTSAGERVIHGRVIPDRIVGGRIVTPGEIPYIVSLRWFGSHFCGGTILNENTIITAAHCLYGYEEDPYVIVAGEWSLTGNDGTEQFRDASGLIVHEAYDDWEFVNDIALMFVNQSFEFNEFVQPVVLPPAWYTGLGPAPVSGWGVEAEGGEDLSDKLKTATLEIIDDERCRTELGFPEEVKDSMICAYHPPGGIDSCQGDSGGPLMAFDRAGEAYQAGIVSWGYGCARQGVPGMYTEVSHFINWISANQGRRI